MGNKIRIGVISDTHIPDRAKDIPAKILEDFKNVDLILHAGDLVGLEVLEELKKACGNVRAVWGNMDPAEIKANLPEKDIFKAGNYRIGLIHGYGAPNKLIELLSAIFKDEHLDIIVFGHAHFSVNEKRGNTLFFNPGSCTDKTYSAYNSYGIIEINDKIEARIIKL